MDKQSKPVMLPAIIFSEKVISEAGTGKLSMINSFQRFHGHEFPFAVQGFVVSVAFTGLSGKIEGLKIGVEVVDPNGKQIVAPVMTEAVSDVEVTPAETFELSFHLPTFQFDAPGAYQVLFRVGDDVVGQRALPASLIQLPDAPAPPVLETPTQKSSRSAKNGKSKRR